MSIKSKKAIEHIEEQTEWTESLLNGYFMYPSDALEAIKIAEQDAEERAMKAFDQWCRRVNKNIDETIHKQVILEFKQLLNGGQSDE